MHLELVDKNAGEPFAVQIGHAINLLAAKFIVSNTSFLVFNAQFLVFDITQFLVFETQFISFTYNRRTASRRRSEKSTMLDCRMQQP